MVRPVITDCQGLRLSDAEKELFSTLQPLGFILFQRNCDTPDQVQALTNALRAAVGRENVPILIDQEGGRVTRLKPPHWRAAPPPAAFAELPSNIAETAARLNARLLAAELRSAGVTVNCLPLLDILFEGAHSIIGDRSYGSDPARVADLGRATCEGLMAGGIVPVIKHIPGHGRARVDSHLALPKVYTSLEDLRATDFKPFQALNDMPVAMTAHVTYTAIDSDHPATTSVRVIDQIIRGEIGFEGVLLSDDITMKALGGPVARRALDSIDAGCDAVLHCNAGLDERRMVLETVPDMTENAFNRISGLMACAETDDDFDIESSIVALDQLLTQMT